MNGLFTCGFLPVHHSAETSANTAILSPFLNEIRSYKRHQKEATKNKNFFKIFLFFLFFSNVQCKKSCFKHILLTDLVASKS